MLTFRFKAEKKIDFLVRASNSEIVINAGRFIISREDVASEGDGWTPPRFLKGKKGNQKFLIKLPTSSRFYGENIIYE